jgi:hypothetical protein
VRQIKKFGLSADLTIYELRYTCAAATNAPLNRSVNEHMAKGEITEAGLRRPHDTHHSRAANRFGEKLVGGTDPITDSAGDLALSSARGRRRIATARREIESSPDQADLRNIAKGVPKIARAIGDRPGQLDRAVSHSSSAVRWLAASLEAARAEAFTDPVCERPDPKYSDYAIDKLIGRTNQA